jgi:hypothetical protein
LLAATKVPAATTYPATADCAAGDQFCADQIAHSPMGGITQNRIAWVNRPTYQQVIEFPARRGDDVSNPAPAQSVRVTGTRRATSYGYALHEFQVFRR